MATHVDPSNIRDMVNDLNSSSIRSLKHGTNNSKPRVGSGGGVQTEFDEMARPLLGGAPATAQTGCRSSICVNCRQISTWLFLTLCYIPLLLLLADHHVKQTHLPKWWEHNREAGRHVRPCL